MLRTTYPFIPPCHCFIGPVLVFKQIDYIVVEHVGLEASILNCPRLFAVENVSTLETNQYSRSGQCIRRTMIAAYAIVSGVSLMSYSSATVLLPGIFPGVFFKAVRGAVNMCRKHCGYH